MQWTNATETLFSAFNVGLKFLQFHGIAKNFSLTRVLQKSSCQYLAIVKLILTIFIVIHEFLLGK